MKLKRILLMLPILFVMYSNAQSQQITKEDLLLEAVGALSGQNMYLTYGSLGHIADSFAAGVYQLDFALEMTDELREMIAMTIQKYEEMLSSKLIFGDDYNAIMNFIDVYKLLLQQEIDRYFQGIRKE